MERSGADLGVALLRDVMVCMRDGVRLATDVYRPARDGELLPGPFPTILSRTSYDKAAQRYVDIADYFTPRGYVVVLQDLRGRHHSEGVGQYFHTANPTEGDDGYDTVEWIASQGWSSGRVGTVGSSHPALASVILALKRPPHLSAQWADVTPTDSYRHQVRMGGAMQLHMFGAMFNHAMDAPEIKDDPAARESILDALANMRDWVMATPFRPGQTPIHVVPNLEKTLFDYYWRGAYDEYWAAEYNDMRRHFPRHADVPMTHSGGWFDPFSEATTDYYATMTKQNRSPQRLIMGPWAHTTMRSGLTSAGDVDFGPDSAWGLNRYYADLLRFFDRWLKDRPTGIENDPPVRLFVMGGGSGRRLPSGKLDHGGCWRDEQEWPPARTQHVIYFLQPDRSLSTDQPPADAPPASYSFDHSNPVPTVGGSLAALMELVPLSDKLDPFWSKNISPWLRLKSIVAEGPMHQKTSPEIVGARPPYLELSTRPDVLVFQTPPLLESIEVTGEIDVELWASSSAVDTDITAKLIDVYPASEDYPGGYHLNLTDAILRLRYRNSFEREELLTPGEIVPVRFKLPPTSNVFAPGHRIRLDVSSSNFPRFDINPNTGEPVGRHTHTVVAHNAIFTAGDHASHIVLPIIPKTGAESR